MKHGILFINLCFLLAVPAFADTTVNSEFVITNRTIESSNFDSQAPGFVATDTTGSGLYKMSDNFEEANSRDIMSQWGLNQQPGIVRTGSLFSIKMKGEKLGHEFTVKGKYAESSLIINSEGGSAKGGYTERKNSGCTSLEPVVSGGSITVTDKSTVAVFSIKSDSNMAVDCKANSDYVVYKWTDTYLYLSSTGNSRVVYLDLESLQKDKKYRDAPPDIYTGSNTYTGDLLRSHNGIVKTFEYINNIKIIKNPYFENVSLPKSDNVFAVRTVGNDVSGDLVIPYVINGHFTPYNRITLSVSSLNDFKLKDKSGYEIPYSLTTGIGRQKEHSLVTSGTSHSPVTITNLMNENYALQGQFNANFSIDKSAVNQGEYTDTLTAIFEISLE
ncbi:fimbrial protein [Salmonella enterica subsp. enterica serovar Stanley]|nr:fimbrial protein [Salmonella enterica subsp. enterica serovar Stanley]